MTPRIHFPPLPVSVVTLPFLFMPARAGDRDWDFNAALAAAVAADGARDERASTRRRVAGLLCELARQYARRCGDPAQPVPVSRQALARALGVSLTKVKRVLALLALSDAIESDCESVRILDWRRLAALGGDGGRPPGRGTEEDDAPRAPASKRDETAHLFTAPGEPAFFG